MKKLMFATSTALIVLSSGFINQPMKSLAAENTIEYAPHNQLAGISVVMKEFYHGILSESGISVDNVVTPVLINGVRLEAVNTPASELEGMAICTASNYVEVRKKADEASESVAKLYKDSVAKVIKQGKEWSLVSSGSVKGYVNNEYLLFDEQAKEEIQEKYTQYARATCVTLNIRSEASTEASIIDQVGQDQKLTVVSVEDEWVQVDYQNTKESYVSKNYVDLTYKFTYAVTPEEEKRLEEEKRQAELNDIRKYDVNNMVWPLPSNHTIHSYFGYRKAPTVGASTYHQGLDIGGTQGTEIVSVLSGTVVKAEYSSSRGYYVEINHGNGYVTRYQHASKLLVSAGQKVVQGQSIALVGSTGVSTGPHLHFSLVRNGTNIDPYPYLRNVH